MTDILINSSFSQSKACSLCKFSSRNDSSCKDSPGYIQSRGCSASSGQYYPRKNKEELLQEAKSKYSIGDTISCAKRASDTSTIENLDFSAVITYDGIEVFHRTSKTPFNEYLYYNEQWATIIDKKIDKVMLSVNDKVKLLKFNYIVIKSSSSSSIKYYLNNDLGSNDAIFTALKIENKSQFVSNIVGYNCDGNFPEVKSLEDLAKVIEKLKSLISSFEGSEEELLFEARKKYPIGTKFVPAHISDIDDGEYCIITEDSAMVSNSEGTIISKIPEGNYSSKDKYGTCTYNRVVYYKGKWAKIFSKKTTTIKPESLQHYSLDEEVWYKGLICKIAAFCYKENYYIVEYPHGWSGNREDCYTIDEGDISPSKNYHYASREDLARAAKSKDSVVKEGRKEEIFPKKTAKQILIKVPKI